MRILGTIPKPASQNGDARADMRQEQTKSLLALYQLL